MSVEFARQRARLGLVGIALLGLATTPNAFAATPNVTSESQASIREANGGKLQALADSEGALGLYVDEDTDDFVVVVPAAGQSRFTASDAASLGLPVRIETRDMDADTLDRITEALEAVAPSVVGHAFSFGFDPESG